MLSVIIITKNEAGHIAQCLESVAWVDEIIVLDSGSTDGTVEICKRHTQNVYETDWPGFGLQKQRALDLATGDWVLSIDADETVDGQLRTEIEQAMQSNGVDGYEIPRLTRYCGQPIRHGGWWPDYVLRLFRRGKGRFTDALVHEIVRVEGKVGRLKSPLQHISYVNLEEVLEKVNSYSSLGAEMLFRRGKRSSVTKAVLKGLWMFVRTYFLRMALLDGGKGLMMSVSSAEATYYKYLKLIELQEIRRNGQ